MLRTLAYGLPGLLALAAIATGCAVGGGEDAGAVTDTGPLLDAGRRDAGRDAGRVLLPDAGPLDAGVDAGAFDAGPPVDAGPPPDAGPLVDAGRDSGGISACTPAVGTVEISEIMVASRSGSGDLGEWFEIHNLSTCTINLNGLRIVSGANSYDVPSGILTAGGYFVFAQSGQSAQNGMLAFDHVYGSSGISFPNSAGSVAIEFGGDTIDTASWSSQVDYRPAISRQLVPGQTGGGSIGGLNFCDPDSIYSTDPFERRGTPGSANLCP